MSMNGNGSNFSAPKGHKSIGSCRPLRPGAGRLKSSAPEAQGDGHAMGYPPPPPPSVDGIKPAAPSGDYVQEGTLAHHDNQTGDLPRCERMAEESQPCQNGTIDRVCAEHKNPAVTATAVTRAAHCEHAGCNRTPRYGTQDGLPRFCQAHKRAGQYTIRDGELFVATRDGSAFRKGSGNNTSGAAAAPVPKSAAHSTAAPTAATAPPQEANTLSSLPVPPQKLCEEPDCDVESIYGTFGSDNPRFCLRHKKKSHVSLSNRPCLFRGCDIRPRYGLWMGNAEFCVTHKKKGMVHLLKEANNLEKEAHARRRRKSCLHVAERKARPEPKYDTGKAVAPAEKPVKGHKEGGGANGMGGRKGKGPARGKGSARTVAFAAKLTQAKERKKNGKASRLLAPSPLTSSTPDSSLWPASAQANQSSPLSRKAEAPGLPPSGLAPSDEMRLFQEARESARAAAEASGSGRRARAPSRKLLEASGKMTGESIQWMTREKKEEEVRLKMEMKEQRKAAAAAGLKCGHVFEAVALPAPVRARAGAGVEGIASGGALSGGEGAASNVPRQKLTPVKFGRADGKLAAVGEAQQSLTGSAGTTAEASDGATTDEKGERAPAPPAAEENVVSDRKRKGVASAGGPTARRGSTVVEVSGKRKPKRSRQAKFKAERDGSKDHAEQGTPKGRTAGGGGAAGKTTGACESESCSKTATFGVNGTVRYCKTHRIFGMYKIVR